MASSTSDIGKVSEVLFLVSGIKKVLSAKSTLFQVSVAASFRLKPESSKNQAGTGKKNKATNKKTAKKNVAKTARSSQRQSTEVVETPVVAQETFVEISSDLKQKIENLIKEKNYSAAEAQINLALNQDNRQLKS